MACGNRCLAVFGFCLLGLGLTGCGDTHEKLTADSIAAMKEFSGIIASIKDEPSAQAAKPKLEALGDRMEALRKRRDALGQPTKEQEEALKKKYEPEVKQIAEEMLPNMMRVAFDPKLSVHVKDSLEKIRANQTVQPGP
jgi:hypothetical protein